MGRIWRYLTTQYSADLERPNTAAEQTAALDKQTELLARGRRLSVHLGLGIEQVGKVPWDSHWLVVVPILEQLTARIEALEGRLPPEEL